MALTMSDTSARQRYRALRFVFAGGVILLVGGIATSAIIRVVTTLSAGSRPVQYITEAMYTGYQRVPTNPYVLEDELMFAFLGVAAIGLLLLAVAVALRVARRRPPEPLARG